MTTHDKDKIIAAFDSWAASKNPKYRSTDDSVSDRSLREAFAAGAASRYAEIAELVAALNRLYVACPVTLECNHFHHSKKEKHGYLETCGPAEEYLAAIDQAGSVLAKVRKP